MKIIAGHGLLDRIEISGVPRSRRNTVNTNTSGRADSSRERVRLRNGPVINPGGSVLFLRSARTADRRPPLYRSMSGPARLTGIKACARTDRDNAPRGFAASAGALDDQGHYRQSGARIG